VATSVSLYVLGAREKSGFSQLKLGELIGVSRDTIRRWEKGVSEPGLKEIEKIGEVTGHPFNGASLYKFKKRPIYP